MLSLAPTYDNTDLLFALVITTDFYLHLISSGDVLMTSWDFDWHMQ